MKKSPRPKFDPKSLPMFPKGTPVRILPKNVIHIGYVGVVIGMTPGGRHLIEIPLTNPTPLNKVWHAEAFGDCLEEYL